MANRDPGLRRWVPAGMILVLTAVSACGRPRQGQPDVHPVYAAAQKSVFAIGGERAGVQGTAFLVRHRRGRHLISSFHVVSRLDKPFIQSESGQRFGNLRVLAVDRRHDVVVLDAGSLPPAWRGLWTNGSYATSQPVFLVGYPAMSWESSHLNFATGVISDARFMGPVFIGKGEVEYIQATTPVNLGHSGSPLLNDRAEVLGVMAWRYEPYSEIQAGNYAVPVRHALALVHKLDAHGTPRVSTISSGRRCLREADCRGLEFCMGGTCQRLHREGAACDLDENCLLPLVCHEGRCAPTLTAGKPCPGDWLCQPPLLCILGSCRPVGQEADACGHNGDCVWPLACERGRCAKVAPRRMPVRTQESPREPDCGCPVE